MRTVRFLRKAGLSIEYGVRYADIETAKIHNIDIVGEIHVPDSEATHRLDIVVECRATDAPWIAFTTTHQELNSHPFSLHVDECQKCVRGHEIELECFPLRDILITHDLVQKQSDDAGSQSPPHAAAAELCDAIHSFKKALPPAMEPDGYHLSVTWIPIIVTTAPLFSCELVENEIKLAEIEHVVVSVPANNATSSCIPVHVFTESSFDSYTYVLADAMRDL
jgi:hypothetical protein